MDLDLSLGPPRSGRRHPALALGFDLALASPAAPSPSSASSSSSSSTEEPRAPIPAPPAAMAEPPPFPYPHSCAAFADPTGRPPPIPSGGGDLAREYSPYSPSYQPLGPPYTPIPPPPPARRHGLLHPASYFRIFPADQGSDHGFPLHPPYDPLSPTGPEEAALVGGSGAGGALPHVLYSPPSYAHLSVIPEEQEEAAYARRQIFLGSPDTFVRDDDGSSSRPGLLDAEVHLSRWFASRRRPWEGRFFQPSSPYGDELPSSATAAVDLDHSVASAEISDSGKNKAGVEGAADEGLEEDDEERDTNAVNFECNICLELAKEPVVTPCGHLFCWPCLYQWLHLHCNYNECPVCKGQVTESEITPIYGRGSSQSSRVEVEEDGELGLKIPPRPRGRRSESWRQRIQRPISRRFGLEVASSWRRLFGEEVHFGNMIDVHGDPSLQQVIGVESTSIGRGSSTRVGDGMENGYFSIGHPLPWRNASSFPQNGGNTNSILRGGFNEMWAQVSSNGVDRSSSLAAAAIGPSRILSRTDSSANITTAPAPLLPRNHSGFVLRPAVGSSRAVGQASASSTMAVIQGDMGVADAAAEPLNSAGSSRNPRIRGRSGGSLYADGCPIHTCKGRRMN